MSRRHQGKSQGADLKLQTRYLFGDGRRQLRESMEHAGHELGAGGSGWGREEKGKNRGI